MAGQLLGHIDCPSCKAAKGMRVTKDKNGNPFGYCEANCAVQLRVGGDQNRVRAFFKAHPEIEQAWRVSNGETGTDTVTGNSAPETPAPAPEKPAPRSPLELLGVKA